MEKEIKKILGEIVQEGIDLNKLQNKKKKDSWEWWLIEGAKKQCLLIIDSLQPLVTPSDIPTGTKISIDKNGDIKSMILNK